MLFLQLQLQLPSVLRDKLRGLEVHISRDGGLRWGWDFPPSPSHA